MGARLSTLAAVVVAALCAAAPALANEPFWTQRPDLTRQGDQLYASNGGWWSYSGPVTKNLYRFLRDGVVVKGLDGTVPKDTDPGVSLPGVTPDDPGAPYYALSAADNGHCFVAEVWGGIHSRYVFADGTVAYDEWEWGHLNSFGEPAVTNQVCVGDAAAPAPPAVEPPAPPPPPPPPPPAPPPPPQLAFASTWLPNGSVGTAYSSRLEARNGTSVAFAVSSGTLPPGLSLSSAGEVNGTPTSTGTFTFTVAATDPVAVGTQQTFSLQITAPSLSLGPQTLRGARANAAFSEQLVVYGGFEPYRYSVAAGALPKGMTLTDEGLLAGAPDAPAGKYTFTVTATDRFQLTTSRELVLTVLPPRMRLDVARLPNGVRGRAYAASVAASGASAPYTFRIAAGTLPRGIRLDTNGRFHGVPARAGVYGVTVMATDANGVVRKRYYALRIRAR